ncbi:glycosyltransferase [Romeria aff. gracilis LEGE 07310]|uniref:Glycosyltransferase n=1 Tax=Vasconcelosia minhoensis LEGE 07310 TaxID=915328 RepID=A0A8J7DCD7_9CYAN|nr:glycosyltransferase [Romeria gracilis]MBE9078787.1 glycosyltransferase [Romeria aff. gracilis LEGE 07310]
MESALLGLVGISAAIWLGLLGFWGQFWRADQRLDTQESPLETWPTVAVVIPARDEAELIGTAARSHLTQTYAGPLSIVLVDDQSTDDTAEIVTQVAEALEETAHLKVLSGKPLPPVWTGKLWAMEQGFRYLQQQPSPPDYLLFTDADIEHDPASVQQLVTKAESEKLDLVSLMVRLRCQSAWEKLLIPAFVFFFQLLYPFPWVNNSNSKMAAAAGGCALIRFSALERIDGLQTIRHALIDDCALGAAVKAGGPIWLGLSTKTHSLRPYSNLQSIWNMVARSAYTQLSYSPWLLMGTVLGMGLVYLVPPLGLVVGLIGGNDAIALTGLAGWLLMAWAYWPTLRLYGGSPPLALALPLIALLYTLMTLDSARRHWAGKGGAWKGRIYSDLQ